MLKDWSIEKARRVFYYGNATECDTEGGKTACEHSGI